MKKTVSVVFCCVALVAVVSLAGCGGGGNSDSGGTASVNVTGTWIGLSLSGDEGAILNLSQSGSSVTGTANDTEYDYPLTSGSVSGNVVTVTWYDGEYTYTVSGTVSGDCLTMAGTWSATDGESGNFNAWKVS